MFAFQGSLRSSNPNLRFYCQLPFTFIIFCYQTSNRQEGKGCKRRMNLGKRELQALKAYFFIIFSFINNAHSSDLRKSPCSLNGNICHQHPLPTQKMSTLNPQNENKQN